MSMHRNLKLGLLVTALGFAAAMPAAAASFSFGVMSDTQWKSNLDGQNPGTVAVGIINQINQQFIAKDVKFVIQVGDLVDSYSAANMDARVAAAQPLYDAGIGFFPLRGNHESSSSAANYVPTVFPQTTGGGSNTVGASNFSSPFTSLNGLSYSFDYGNARFVMLDQFTRKDNTNYLGSSNNNIIDQQTWINSTLTSKAADSHAFVFSHKGLITANHTDGLFGTNPASNPSAQNAFMGSLDANGVHYLFNGHDHNHQRSVITSPDGNSQVQDITTSSNSYKFYVPQTGTNINDVKYNNPTRETPIAQELFTVGYYTVTVDGPRVTVDHYASNNGCGGSLATGGVDCDLTVTPNLTFEKRETFGYSLNGKEFLVASGTSFAGLADSITAGNGFVGTSMQFLDGVNGHNVNLYDGRATVSAVNTGWISMDEVGDAKLRSDVLSLWGVSDLSNSEANNVKLSMSYTGDDAVYLLKRVNGQWVNAGTDMGYDALTHTAWATVSQSALEAGEFVVAVPEPETYAMMLAGLGLVGFMARRRAV